MTIFGSDASDGVGSVTVMPVNVRLSIRYINLNGFDKVVLVPMTGVVASAEKRSDLTDAMPKDRSAPDLLIILPRGSVPKIGALSLIHI